MTKKSRKWLIGSFILIVVVLGLIFWLKPNPAISVQKDQNQYIVELVKNTQIDQHQLTVQENQCLQMHWQIDSGKAVIIVYTEYGEPIYQANEEFAGDFVIHVPADGVYTVKMKCLHASGSVIIKKVDING